MYRSYTFDNFHQLQASQINTSEGTLSIFIFDVAIVCGSAFLLWSVYDPSS